MPGDFFYARGQLDEEGYLNADGVWVNIVNLTGSLELSSDRGTGQLMLPDKRIYHVHMTPQVESWLAGAQVDGSASLPASSSAAQVVGAWDEATGTIDVTTCWA